MVARLTRREKAAINRLEKLADFWPDSLMLFSWMGNLVVVEKETGRTVADIDIENDGGDPNNYTDKRGDVYIDFDNSW